MSALSTGLTIYVDESGNPDFRDRNGSGKHDGYVVAAVGAPALSHPVLYAILPRAHDGRLLKASDRELGPNRLARFVSEFLATGATLSLVMLDTTSAANVQRAKEFVAIAQARRRERHNPQIGQAGLIYMRVAFDAIALCWTHAKAVHGPLMRHWNVVLDSANLSVHDTALMRELLAWLSHSLDGIDGGAIWSREADDPHLLLPDLLAYVYRRSATHGDVGAARDLMETALASGRILLQDGMSTRDYGPELELRGLTEVDDPRDEPTGGSP